MRIAFGAGSRLVRSAYLGTPLQGHRRAHCARRTLPARSRHSPVTSLRSRDTCRSLINSQNEARDYRRESLWLTVADLPSVSQSESTECSLLQSCRTPLCTLYSNAALVRTADTPIGTASPTTRHDLPTNEHVSWIAILGAHSDLRFLSPRRQEEALSARPQPAIPWVLW